MKTMYCCEKCGKTSENYDEIAKCEQMHFIMPRPWYDVDGLAEMLDSMTEYKEGQEEPNVIHVMYTRSYWSGDEWKEEKRCGKYKLISSYATPTVRLSNCGRRCNMSELFRFYRDRVSACPFYGFVSGSELLAVVVRSASYNSELTQEEFNSIIILAAKCREKMMEENYNAGWNE